MVIALFGESCVGKSTLGEKLRARCGAAVVTGKDYLRCAKTEAEAARLFRATLAEKTASSDVLVYVIGEKEHLALLPDGCVRVLVTAPLALIQERFAKRTGGRLPPPVAAMLERKHGLFDGEPCDVHIISGETDPDAACDAILSAAGRKIHNM